MEGLIAVDTNVVVRFLVRDDEAQWQAAHGVFAGGHIALLPTVLLEAEWVLRAVYGIERKPLADALRKLCGVVAVVVPNPDLIRSVIDDYEGGFDFADAMHARSARGSGIDTLVTFDSALTKRARAGRLGIEVRRLKSKSDT